MYNANLGMRQKVDDNVSFPLILDLQNFTNDTTSNSQNPSAEPSQQSHIRDPPAESSSALKYRLNSILLHLGDSAYGGHYVAQILDEEYAHIDSLKNLIFF